MGNEHHTTPANDGIASRSHENVQQQQKTSHNGGLSANFPICHGVESLLRSDTFEDSHEKDQHDEADVG
eukprot:6465835-Amphidinium_carterae.3